MKECLGEKSLLACCLGEADHKSRVHLQSCIICARRYRRLRNELLMLDQTLIKGARLKVRSEPSHPPMVLARKGLALIAAFALGSLLGPHPGSNWTRNLGALFAHGWNSGRYRLHQRHSPSTNQK
ncbi:MAG TPA: hypothetical protein VKV28_14395 [Candidatus Binataceae bacterium]|nr:hypothetical protein [Candidatus Binataceae bacterium]